MNKKASLLWIGLSSIFVVVFNVVVFQLNSTYTDAFWVSYGFIHLAYLMLVLSVATMLKVKNSEVLGYPLIFLTSLYFVGSFIVGIIFMVFKHVGFTMSFIPQVFLAGLYAFVYLLKTITNKHTISDERASQAAVLYIKEAASELNMLMRQTTDAVLKKKIEKLNDAVRNSQVKSHPTLAIMEQVILRDIQELKENVSDLDNLAANSTIDRINGRLAERNTRISNLRHIN